MRKRSRSGTTTEESPPQGLADQRVKHLEMIQAVITRLGNDSFLIKGWAVTVNSVFLGFAVSSKEPRLAVVAILPAVLFWGLDTYYLRSERLFRVFYERVRLGAEEVEPFGMNATAPDFVSTLGGADAENADYWKTTRRPTLAVLYGGLVAAAVLVAVAVALFVQTSDNDSTEKSPAGCPQSVSQKVKGC